MLTIQLDKVTTTYDGFEKLIEVEKMLQCSGDNSPVDVQIPGWFDANMSAPLGAILERQKQKGRVIYISSAPEILQRNHFLSHFEVPIRPDIYKTTIRYHCFGIDKRQSYLFQNYISAHFHENSNVLPAMTIALLKRFRTSIFEIYANSCEHSDSTCGVFACGQTYPKQKSVDFTIADAGIGIARNIERAFGVPIPPDYALIWALRQGTTTRKSSSIPGGIGLHIIRQFIKLNGGRLLVISDRGYWEMKGEQTELKTFKYPFPGTVVTIEINTDDKHSYCLESEINSNNIF